MKNTATLAVTRPVFRGLRPGGPLPRAGIEPASLAVTRPVFRGLRQGFAPLVQHEGVLESCSDETRFQGIATPHRGQTTAKDSPVSCSDETRFQGIATITNTRIPSRVLNSQLAVTRPVFRGLRL